MFRPSAPNKKKKISFVSVPSNVHFRKYCTILLGNTVPMCQIRLHQNRSIPMENYVSLRLL